MPLEGEYEPNQLDFARDQVDLYERSGGTEGTTMQGVPVIVVTNLGVRSGKLRKIPLIRVEHDGTYAAVASKGGSPEQPHWYYNLVAEPHVEVQDGPEKTDMIARLASGDERDQWWERATAVWPDYEDYQSKTERQIPVFVLEPAAS